MAEIVDPNRVLLGVHESSIFCTPEKIAITECLSEIVWSFRADTIFEVEFLYSLWNICRIRSWKFVGKCQWSDFWPVSVHLVYHPWAVQYRCIKNKNKRWTNYWLRWSLCIQINLTTLPHLQSSMWDRPQNWPRLSKALFGNVLPATNF